MASRIYRFLSKLENPILKDRKALKSLTIDNSWYQFWEVQLEETDYDTALTYCREAMLRGETAFAFPWVQWPRAIFFDMDATVIQEESIVELARAAGKAALVSEITERAMAGELDFKEALRARVEELKGLGADILEHTRRHLNLQPGIKELIQMALERDTLLYLVSGGFIELAGPLGKSLGFKGVHANELLLDGGYLTGKVGDIIVDGAEKSRFVAATIADGGITASEVAVIGDGANDREMMTHGNMTFGFRPKQSLIPSLNGAVYQGDHQVILEMWSSDPFS